MLRHVPTFKFVGNNLNTPLSYFFQRVNHWKNQRFIMPEGKSWQQFSRVLVLGRAMLNAPLQNGVEKDFRASLREDAEEAARQSGALPSVSGDPKPSRTRATRANKRWSKRYRNQLRITDFIIIALAVAGAQVLRFGRHSNDSLFSDIAGVNVHVTYTLMSVLLVFGWMINLSVVGTRDHRTVGAGAEEYKLVVEATARLFGTLAIVDLLFKLNISRGYLLISLPVGLSLLLVSRWLWRK